MTFEQWFIDIIGPVEDEGDRIRRCDLEAAWNAAALAERERCAKIAEQTHAELDAKFSPEGCTDSALVAADRIRAIEGNP